MTEHRPRSERGQLAIAGENYGSSLLGAPLLYFPAAVSGPETGLIIAGTHGDESAAIVTLSCALRSIAPEQLRHHVVLAVNPDGCQLGLRANANGVDLNRNFPAANWRSGDTVYRWNSAAPVRDVKLSTGRAPRFRTGNPGAVSSDPSSEAALGGVVPRTAGLHRRSRQLAARRLAVAQVRTAAGDQRRL